MIMTFARILLGTDKRVIPLPVVAIAHGEFFGTFTMTTSVQSSGSCFSFQMTLRSSSKISALKSSAFRLS